MIPKSRIAVSSAKRCSGRLLPAEDATALHAELLSVVAGHALGLLQAPPEVVEATAVRLEEVASRCRPDADVVVNPAKRLALELSGEVD